MRVHIIGNPDMPYHKAEDYEELMLPVFQQAGHEVTMSTDHTDLNTRLLAELDVLVLYTTGEVLGSHQAQALLSFVQRGGGLVGIHAATCSFQDSEVYMDLIAGKFIRHPEHQVITIEIEDPEHPITQGLESFEVPDELYLMETQPARYHLLATCPFEAEQVHVAWAREEGEGRVYYCSLGHGPESLSHPSVQQLHLRGAEWAGKLL